MAKLKFFDQLWDKTDIPNVKGDANFKEFIFQVKNDDTDTKNDFALMVYGRDMGGLDYPAGLKHDSLHTDLSASPFPSRRRVNIANIVMSRAKLASGSPTSFHHFRFKAEEYPSDPNYVTYTFWAEDRDNNPVTFLNSPYEIYDKDVEFKFGDEWGVYEEKIEVNGELRSRIRIRLNPSPPATS